MSCWDNANCSFGKKKNLKKTGEMDVGKISLRTGQVKSHLLLIWVRNNHTIKEFKVRQG